LGTARYTGDAGDLTELRSTERPLTFSADVFCGKRLLGFSEGSSVLMLGMDGCLGYRLLQGVHPEYDFATTAIPVSVTLDASLNLLSHLHPYVSTGAGLIAFSVTQNRVGQEALAHRVVSNTKNGVTAYIPLRVGLRLPLSTTFRIDASFEQSVTFADNLDGLSLSQNDWRYDNYHTLTLGVSWTINPCVPTIYAFHTPEDDASEKPLPPKISMLLGPPPPSVLMEDVGTELLADGKQKAPQTSSYSRSGFARKSAKPLQNAPSKQSEAFRSLASLPNIAFAASSANLKESSVPILDSLAETLTKDPRIHCDIVWLQTASKKSTENGTLPWLRALTVLERFRAAGIPSDRVHVSCLGRSPENDSEKRLLPEDACLELLFSRQIVQGASTATEAAEEPPR
jgi:hypothetical protein